MQLFPPCNDSGPVEIQRGFDGPWIVLPYPYPYPFELAYGGCSVYPPHTIYPTIAYSYPYHSSSLADAVVDILHQAFGFRVEAQPSSPEERSREFTELNS
jgi:hypothetical protein